MVFNGDVLTQVDLGAVMDLHRERRAKATIVLTPVDNPTAYGLVETDPDGNILRFLEKPKPDEITCDTINAGIYVLEPDTFDRIPKNVAWSIERSFFPSFIERGETFIACDLSRLLDRHRHAGEIHAGAPRHHGRTLHGAAVHRPAGAGLGVAASAQVENGARLEGPRLHRCRRVVKAGARIGPYTVLGDGCRVDEGANVSGAIVWPNTRDRPGSRRARTPSSGAAATIGRNATVGGRRARRQDGDCGLQPI